MLRGDVSGPVRICFISLMLSALLAGCGGGDEGGSAKEREALRIEQFQQDVRIWCTTGVGEPIGAADPLGTMITAVDELIKIYRKDEDATYKMAKFAKTGDKLGLREISIRKVLGDTAALLGNKCGRYALDQSKRIERTLSG